MKILARGSGFLGTVALLSMFFYFQPTAEAVTIAIDSPNNLQTQFNNQDNPTDQPLEQTQDRIFKGNSQSNSAKLSEVSSFRATAYCLKGRTATGGSVRRGIIAADPRVLRLGSQVMLGAGSYSGTYTVADTGGAVKGRKIDIWMPSCVEAVRFGNRSVTVMKLNKRG